MCIRDSLYVAGGPGGDGAYVNAYDRNGEFQFEFLRIEDGGMPAFIISEFAAICDDGSQGDIDGDGQVAFSDFLILSDNFGEQVASHELGDIDCDGTVAFGDFIIMSANFDSDISISNVPEPTLSLILLPLLLCYRNNRGKINQPCLLYTSPSPRDLSTSRMPSSA